MQLAPNNDVKPFWRYVQSKQKVKVSIGPLIKNSYNNLTENNQECANVLGDKFSSVFTQKDLNFIPFVPSKTQEKVFDKQFTYKLISKHLHNLKNFSSPELDNIPNIV